MFSCYAFVVVPNGFDYKKFNNFVGEDLEKYLNLYEALTFVISGRTKNEPTKRVSQHKSKWNAVINALTLTERGEKYRGKK